MEVVQRLLLAVVVLAPGEHAAEHDEHEHDDDPADGEPPPERRRTAPERRLEASPALVRRRRLRRQEGHGEPSATRRRLLGRRAQGGVDVLHDRDDLREADDLEHAPRLGARRGEHGRPALRPRSLRTAWTSALIPLESMNSSPLRSNTTCAGMQRVELGGAPLQLPDREDVDLADERDHDHAVGRPRDGDRQRLGGRRGLAHGCVIPRNAVGAHFCNGSALGMAGVVAAAARAVKRRRREIGRRQAASMVVAPARRTNWRDVAGGSNGERRPQPAVRQAQLLTVKRIWFWPLVTACLAPRVDAATASSV